MMKNRFSLKMFSLYKCPFHLAVGSKLDVAFVLCLSTFSYCEQVTGEQEDSLIPGGPLRGLSFVYDCSFSIYIPLKNESAFGEPCGSPVVYGPPCKMPRGSDFFCFFLCVYVGKED
jgi:hypothetical protein